MYTINHHRAPDDYDTPFKICPNCGCKVFDGDDAFYTTEGELIGCGMCMERRPLEIDPDDDNIGWE